MSIETTNLDLDHDNQVNELQEKRDFLLNPEKFELLMKAQRDIEAVTEMRPTFKKLINALVTVEAVDAVKMRLIEQMTN